MVSGKSESKKYKQSQVIGNNISCLAHILQIHRQRGSAKICLHTAHRPPHHPDRFTPSSRWLKPPMFLLWWRRDCPRHAATPKTRTTSVSRKTGTETAYTSPTRHPEPASFLLTLFHFSPFKTRRQPSGLFFCLQGCPKPVLEAVSLGLFCPVDRAANSWQKTS